MGNGMDFKGRSLMTKKANASADNPDKAQQVMAMVLVDATGAPVSLSGATAEVLTFTRDFGAIKAGATFPAGTSLETILRAGFCG